MTPDSVPEEPNSPDGSAWDDTLDLVDSSSTNKVPANESDSAADIFEENFARARVRPDSVEFFSRLSENTKWKIAYHTTILPPTNSVNDIPSDHGSDATHTPTTLAISDASKNTTHLIRGSPLSTFDHLSLEDKFMPNDSNNSISTHILLGQQGFPPSSSNTTTSDRKKASEDNNTTTNTKAASTKQSWAEPGTLSKLEMLPQELRDQIYPDLAKNFKEDILPHGWQETNRLWHPYFRSFQPTHYTGPGHYVKRSYFKAKFAGGEAAPQREDHKALPRKSHRTARHNGDGQYRVECGGKDAERHKSGHHQQFVSPRMAVGGYKILMLGNKSFAAEVSTYVFEEMQINAKRRQDYGDLKVEYKSDDLRAYFEKHPEYVAHTKKLIIMINLGQAMMTYEALVEILQPFESLQHVLIKVFFAGLWRDSQAPSIEKFRDLLVLKRGLERVGCVAEDVSFMKDRVVKFKFEHSVAQRISQNLTDDEKASMEERFQKKWETVTREWNGIGSRTSI